MPLQTHSYPIWIDDGLLKTLPELLQPLNQGQTWVIFSQDKIYKHYGHSIHEALKSHGYKCWGAGKWHNGTLSYSRNFDFHDILVHCKQFHSILCNHRLYQDSDDEDSDDMDGSSSSDDDDED